MLRAAEFRERAGECRRLAARLKRAEHRSFASDLANAWTALAECVERKPVVVSDAFVIVNRSEGFDSDNQNGR
jgi:hypothetical protein